MQYANHLGYSDVNPYEVVRVVSAQTLEVREMDAERDESVKLEWAVGGFSGVCLNQRDQNWLITSNAQNPVVRIRLGKQGWKDRHGRRFDLSEPAGQVLRLQLLTPRGALPPPKKVQKSVDRLFAKAYLSECSKLLRDRGDNHDQASYRAHRGLHQILAGWRLG